MKRSKGGRRVAVVGAGLGGLSAAVHLARRGFSVTLYEQSDAPGGKAGSKRIEGYRFDTGPSLVTMTDVFRELFLEAGRDPEDYLSFVPLDVICRYFFSDSTRLDAYADTGELAVEIADKTGEPAGQLSAFLAYSRRIYEVAGDLFLRHSLHDRSTFISATFLRSLRRVFRIDPFRTMDRAVGSFFADPRARQLFDRYATYNGSDPYRTPATLNIIPHVEYNLGGYAAAGGIFSIPTAVERLARELGVEFHYGTRVDRLATERGSGASPPWPVRGVVVDGREELFDAAVSNVDVTLTYRNLLSDPSAPLLRRYERQEPSSSGVVFYWGIDREFSELTVNNIFFSGDYRREFDDIFRRGCLPADPTIYVNITSKVTPSDAPSGGENWFVLVNAPYDRGQEWAREIAELRTRVLRKLSGALGQDVERHIAVEEVMSPADIAERTGSYRGSLYGISSNSPLAAFLRHPNRSKRYPGLYLCGGSVHPGGGMPLSVLSGRIAAELAAKDLSG
ncbi:phytoene desaturase family protein [Salinispira pacifica]